jgi:hypothetical protein
MLSEGGINRERYIDIYREIKNDDEIRIGIISQ